MEGFIADGWRSPEVVCCGVNKFSGCEDMVEDRYVFVDPDT
jgi:hypothetical protein